jgi:hypothetical protein
MNTLDSVRKPSHNKTMGIEIECFVDAVVVSHYNHYGFFYAGADGSIDPDRWSQSGVEFVSQPLTREWMDREIKKLYARFPGIQWNSSCGIHIHVSKKWLSEKKARAIWAFISSLSPEVYASYFGRRPNQYCAIGDHYGSSRYNAINTQNSATIEFRMFASGGRDWALYTVACVDYMIQNAYHLNIDAFNAFVDMHGTYCDMNY